MTNGLMNDDYLRDFEKKTENQYEQWLEPAIYIGLGGFGCNVVRTVKRIAEEHLGEKLLKTLGFIGADTHAYDPINDHLVKEEYVELSVGAIPTILAQQKPKIFDWYISLTKQWKAKSIEGANMVRPVGRLAFVNPYAHSSFMNTLRSIYNRISRFKEVNKLKINIITSVAGGTGAGMFIDVFTSVREFVQPILGGQVTIQAYLAMPEALEMEAPAINLPRFYANTYAALKELYYISSGNMLTARYGTESLSNTVTISSDLLPNSIFIISNGNEYDRKIVQGYESLGQLLATYLLLDILTPLRLLEGSSDIPRGENPIGEASSDGMKRIASSLGTTKFGFPYKEVIDYYSFHIIDCYLNNELSVKKDIDQISHQWIFNNKISEYKSDDLQHTLLKTPQGDSLMIPIDIEDEFEDVERGKMMGRASKLVQSKEDSIIKQVDGLLKRNYDKLYNDLIESLQNKLNWFLSEVSVGSAFHFLTTTIEEIKLHSQSLQEEINETNGQLQNQKEVLKNAIRNIGDAAASGFFGRKNKIRTAIGAYQTELEIYLTLLQRLRSQTAGIKLYKKLIDEMNVRLYKYETLVKSIKARKNYVKDKFYNIQNLLEILSDKYNKKAGNRFSFAKISHIYNLYEKRFDADTTSMIVEKLKESLRKTGDLSNPLLSDDEWLDIVRKSAEPAITSRMEDVNMMTLFHQFYPKDEDKKDLLFSLASTSSPLFPLNPSLKDSYQTVWILAGEDSIRDQFLNIFKPFIPTSDGIILASSKNKFEIIIYTVRHGYTLHSYSRIMTYKANYDRLNNQYLSGIKKGSLATPPIHCFPGAWRWDEVYPMVGEREGNLYFVLGRALSQLFPTHKKKNGSPDEKKNRAFIYRRGRFYYTRDEDEHDFRLGDGLEEALDTFSSRQDIIKLIKTRIEDKIQNMGAENVKPKLEEYLNLLDEDIAKSSGDRKLILEDLKKELKDYIEEMQMRAV